MQCYSFMGFYQHWQLALIPKVIHALVAELIAFDIKPEGHTRLLEWKRACNLWPEFARNRIYNSIEH